MVQRRSSLPSTLFRSTLATLALAGFLSADSPATAQNQTAPPVETANGKVHEVDPVHSFIIFKIKHLKTAYAFGRFNDLEGEVVWDEANPENSSINVAVKSASVDTGHTQRDNHLRSGDFFKVEEHPTITFTSTSIKPLGDDKFELEGELQLLGVTKTLNTTFEKTGTGQNRQGQGLIGGISHFTVKRSDFGMDFMMNGLSDEVEMTVSFEAPAKKEKAAERPQE